MNIYQCEKKAQREGFNSLAFEADFPCGTVKCKWFDAYLGAFQIEMPEFEGKVVHVSQIDDMMPALVCRILPKEEEIVIHEESTE